MKIVEVTIGNNQFIGKMEVSVKDPFLFLIHAVHVSIIRDVQGRVFKKMDSIEKDFDYHGGNLNLANGPGMIVLRLNESGKLAKQYLDTISNIIQLDNKVTA